MQAIKLGIAFILLCLLVPAVFADNLGVWWHDEDDGYSYVTLGALHPSSTSTASAIFVSFTAPRDFNCTEAVMSIWRSSLSISGYLNMSIYNCTGSISDGSSLPDQELYQANNMIDVSTLESDSSAYQNGQHRHFYFDDVPLSNGTDYAFVIFVTDVGAGWGSNWVGVVYKANAKDNAVGGWWRSSSWYYHGSVYDFPLLVYGDVDLSSGGSSGYSDADMESYFSLGIVILIIVGIVGVAIGKKMS